MGLTAVTLVLLAVIGGQVLGAPAATDVPAIQTPSTESDATETTEHDGAATQPASEEPPTASEGSTDAAVTAPQPSADTTVAAEATEEAVSCLLCHGDPSSSTTLPDGSVRSLYVDAEVYSHSVHGGMDCSMCHADAVGETPHPANLAPVDCGACHEEAEEYKTSLHAVAIAQKDDDSASCDDCHGTHNIRRSSDPLSMTHPTRLTETCGRCHSDREKMKKHMVSVMQPSDAYLKSTHAKAVAAGKQAASCNNCHGTHDLQSSNNPASKVYRANIATTCGGCHPKELAEYEESIHGKALKAGIKDSPTCTDCHGEHDIEGPGTTGSPVSQQVVSRQTCPRCHDDERIMERYGIEIMRQASYMDSYHGMASAAGSKIVADCASCHGAHKVLSHLDPESTTYKDNLPQTCGQAGCHKSANMNFAKGPVHIIPTAPGQKALGIVRLVYLWIIGLTIGGMVVHNTLMMGRHAFTKFHVERRGPNVYQRFNKGQIIGHLVLTVAFIVLTISGFALRYPNSWMTKWFFFGDTGLAIRSTVHRAAGLVLIILTVVNVVYIIVSKSGRKELKALMLGWQDVKDVLGNLKYFLGFAKHPPRFDRYSYSEKFEYWGLWWGSVLMIITGLFMWFADEFLGRFPKLGLDIAALIHYYEAWLAMLTIVIWHLYYMIFAPDTYPMNWSWITGNITEEDFKERHPLEFEREILGKSTSEDARKDE